MPPTLAEYDAEYSSSSRRKGTSFLPTSKAQRMQNQRQPQQSYHHSVTPFSPSPLSQEAHDPTHHHRKGSSTSATSSAPASRSTTATSTMSAHPMSMREASLRASEITPTADIACWAHQTHIKQGRSYFWCQGCFPPEVAEPLNIPKAVEKVVTGRRVRISEATHCYDI